MKIFMTSKFKLFELENGVYKPLNKNLVDGLCVGGFSFTVDGKSVSFDWDAFMCNEEDSVFTYESGYGFLFNDHELSDCFEDDWAAIGLSRSDITPEFLASASAIEDFHINFVDACDDEVDLGDNVQYGSENQLECKIELINISFADEDGSEYVMKDDVLKRFNLGYIRSK